MSEDGIYQWRRERMAALADALGGKAALGRKLGYRDGAFVGQMLKGLRPITEKTVEQAEAIRDDALGPTGARGWFSRGHVVSETPVEYESERPPTLAMAVHVLAEALRDLDPVGRELAKSALSSIALDPTRADIAVQALQVAMQSHAPAAPTPAPTSPTGTRKTPAKAPAKRADGKTALVLKIGGGNKAQLALPLRTVRDPFDPRAASQKELEWYGKLPSRSAG